jgi:hypothetical protein
MQRRFSNVLYSITSSTGSYVSLNFDNASLQYFDSPIKQEFDNVLIDNIGNGDIRISLRPGLILTSSITGAKTLVSKDSLYIQESITHITIYFIGTSTVELILILDLDNEDC